MFINSLLPNYPLLQIKNNSMAAANRTAAPHHSGELPIAARI
jgi:hypothetical protein